MANFNPEHKAVLDELLLSHPQVRPGKMFGSPAYFAGKKACICLYELGVSVKLPEQKVAKLLQSDPHMAPFKPMGTTTMREWILVQVSDPEDYRSYLPLFEESIQFVLEQAAQNTA
jgi:hypothetical protein